VSNFGTVYCTVHWLTLSFCSTGRCPRNTAR
jgi:hypothetical protein